MAFEQLVAEAAIKKEKKKAGKEKKPEHEHEHGHAHHTHDTKDEVPNVPRA